MKVHSLCLPMTDTHLNGLIYWIVFFGVQNGFKGNIRGDLHEFTSPVGHNLYNFKCTLHLSHAMQNGEFKANHVNSHWNQFPHLRIKRIFRNFSIWNRHIFVFPFFFANFTASTNLRQELLFEMNEIDLWMMVSYVTFVKKEAHNNFSTNLLPIRFRSKRMTNYYIYHSNFEWECWLDNLSHPRSQVPRYEKLIYESHLCKYFSKCFRIVANFMHRM